LLAVLIDMHNRHVTDGCQMSTIHPPTLVVRRRLRTRFLVGKHGIRPTLTPAEVLPAEATTEQPSRPDALGAFVPRTPPEFVSQRC